MTKQNGHHKSLTERFTELLTAEGIDYATSEEGDALLIHGETEAGSCEGYIVIEELEAVDLDNSGTMSVRLDFCEVAYVVPVGEIEDEDLPGLLELLVRLNESHRIGAYEFNIEERELRFRIYLTLPSGQAIAREHLLLPLYEGISAINTHHEAFRMVLEEGCDPAHATAEIFALEALEDGDLNEELLERANALYDLARARYAARGEDELLADLEARLMRLAHQAGEAMTRSLRS